MDTKSTRVLLFSTSYSPYIGGAELALKEITKRIQGLDFDLITTQPDKKLSGRERIDNVDVFRVPGVKIFYPWQAFLKARSLHKKNKYDAIFALQASHGGGAAWLFKLFNPGVPFILNLQEGKDLDKQSLFVKIFRKLIIQKADVVTAISKYLADY